MSILQINEVTKVYEGKVTNRALNQLSFEVEKGEFLAIMGPSGSGKTTLLNIISTIDMPTSGEIIFDGVKPQTLNNQELAYFRRRQLGFVFQDFNLLPMLTLEENIILPLTLDEQPVAVMEERLQDLSEKLDLTSILTKRPNEISGGQAQRTAIARALIHEPSIILADEPTGNLDTETGMDIFRILEQIKNKGKTVIVATHDEKLLNLATRSLYLKGGRLIRHE